MRNLLSLLFGLVVSVPAFALDTDPGTLVRVRLEKGERELTVNGAGLRVGPDVAEDALRWDRRSVRRANGKWIVTDLAAGVKKTYAGRTLAIRGDGLRTATAGLPSRLTLIARGAKFDVVGELNLRDYLDGVVAHEMPVGWPLETLKAQAVAARSYTLSVRKARAKADYDLESTVDDQVFRLLHDDRRDVDGVRRAVRATDGQVLTVEKGRLLKAYYHADCGGRTQSAAAVWPGEYDAGTAVDESCPATPRARWSAEFALKDVVARLGAKTLVSRVEPLSLVALVERERVKAMALRAPGGTQETLPVHEFRMRMGPDELRSTNFEMTFRRDRVVFKGRGFGHGVGLCQWGSRALGRRGADAVAILKHYYPKARITKL